MNVDEFLEYLCTRVATRELAFLLAEAYDERERTFQLRRARRS